MLLLRLKRNYKYDAEHGRLVNAKTGRAQKGILNSCGYNMLEFRFGDKIVKISLHRSVFAYHHGRWPEKTIDHINGCRTDNRIENLREVSQSENMTNTVYPWKPNKDTGLPGICRNDERTYKAELRGKKFFMANPYRLFYHTTLLGKLYKR